MRASSSGRRCGITAGPSTILDALAGATVCGHLLECGAQTTGGNFSLYADLLDAPGADPGMLDHVAFPLAEVAADGSCVITKHRAPGAPSRSRRSPSNCSTNARESPTADRMSSAGSTPSRFAQDGPDRVTVRGVRGEPAGRWLKVSTNRIGGFRTSMTVPLTGLDIERKAVLLQRQLAPALDAAGEVTVTLARTDRVDAGTAEEASALLHFTVKDSDPAKVGRAFSGPVVASALSSIPGFFVTSPPRTPQPYGVYAPAWVLRDAVQEVVELDGEPLALQPRASGSPPGLAAAGCLTSPTFDLSAPTRRVPLGVLAGARSGDKGGSCTLGVYTRTDAAFAWLAAVSDVSSGSRSCCRRPPTSMSRARSWPTCAPCSSRFPACSGKGWRRRPASIRRQRPSASGCVRVTSTLPIALLEDPASVGRGRPVEGRS